MLLILAFVFFVLRYNISATGGDPFAESEVILGIPFMVERFIGRIVWNGDMYFLSLPNEIYKNIQIDNAFIRFATAIFGSQIIGPLFGYDVSQFEVGRLIWSYWAPDDEVMRGPTNHIDLTAYFYFGSVFGMFFVMLLALFLSQLNRLIFMSNQSDAYRAIIISVIWCKSLGVLMHPAAGFAWFLDVIAVLLFCKLASTAWFSSRATTGATR